jgi:hypothetical protein
MTAGRDLHHPISTGAFDLCLPTSRVSRCTSRAVTKGWSAAMYYGRGEADEFLEVMPDFWTGFQPAHSRANNNRHRSGRATVAAHETHYSISRLRHTRSRPAAGQIVGKNVSRLHGFIIINKCSVTPTLIGYITSAL